MNKDLKEIANLTVQNVADEIISLAPSELYDHKLKIQAMIKRLIHAEKHSVYSRILRNIGFLYKNQYHLELKIQTHKDFVSKKDEEVVTWQV